MRSNIPPEILHAILEFSEFTDLLSCRLVSRAWNAIASRLAYQNQIPVKFFENSVEKIPEFLQRIQQRLDDYLVFAAYEFYLNASDDDVAHSFPSLAIIDQLGETVGHYVTSYTIHLQNYYEGNWAELLSSLVLKAPNLKTLRVYGLESDEMAPARILPHSKLQRLVVMPSSPDLDFKHSMNDEDEPFGLSGTQISEWISQPALTDAHFGFVLECKSEADAISIFGYIQKYDVIELELLVSNDEILKAMCHAPKLISLGLNLPKYIDRHLLYNALQSVSNSLEKLKLTPRVFKGFITFPCFLNLETLEIDFSSCDFDIDANEPIKSSAFPNLKNIEIIGYACSNFKASSLFEEAVFESVENLVLTDYDNDAIMEPWNRQFPNLKSLLVNHPLISALGYRRASNCEHKEGLLSSILTYWPSLQQLRVACIRESPLIFKFLTNTTHGLDTTNKPHIPDKFECVSFHEMKILELRGSPETMTDVGKALIVLTSQKSMPPLDYLALHLIPDNEAEKFSLAVSAAKYHKSIVLNSEDKTARKSAFPILKNKSKHNTFTMKCFTFSEM